MCAWKYWREGPSGRYEQVRRRARRRWVGLVVVVVVEVMVIMVRRASKCTLLAGRNWS